jgi:hypothetical protein
MKEICTLTGGFDETLFLYFKSDYEFLRKVHFSVPHFRFYEDCHFLINKNDSKEEAN